MEITIPDLPDDGPELFPLNPQFGQFGQFGGLSGTHARSASASSANFQFPQAATAFSTPFGPVPAGSVARSSPYPPLRNPFAASSPSNSSSHGTAAESPELQQQRRRPSVGSNLHSRTKSSASVKSHAHQSSSGEQSAFSFGGSHHGHAVTAVPPVPPLLRKDEPSAPLELALYLLLDKFFEKAESKIGDALGRPVVSIFP
jgi:hypothetical protein